MKQRRDLEGYWSKMARFYNRMFGKFKPYEEMYIFIRENLRKEMFVLEVGTGAGLVARAVASEVERVLATDFSGKMIEEAKNIAHLPNITFECADIFTLPYDDNSFEAVVVSNVLHIIPKPEEALQEIRRVLKSGGLLIAPTFLWKQTTMKGKLQMIFMKLSGFPIYSCWDKNSYATFITENNFEIIDSKIIYADFAIDCVIGKLQ